MTIAAVLNSSIQTPATAQAWQQYASAEEAGFSAHKLETARRVADSVRSAAVMAVYRGRVVAAWGDVARELELHSVRKSLVSALFGVGVAEGKINLDATLSDLGIDDRTPLTPQEKQARVRDIISATSGVYLPGTYAGSEQDTERPARESKPRGTHFFYNNWDFNVAGVIYERLMRENLYEAFARRIAQPIGMEDYQPADGFLVYEPSRSSHPAHTFRMSSRDLARFGQLYLQQGKWGTHEVIPPAWIRESTAPKSDLGGGTGYAFMWWTYKAGSFTRYPTLNKYDVYAGSGTGGQAVIVIPGAEMVFVHRGDTDNGREVSGRNVWTIAEMILAAREGSPKPSPALRPLQPMPLESQAPAKPRPVYKTIPATLLAEYAGEYELAPQVVARVFLHNDRLFMNVPGKGEAELLALTDTEFTIAPVAGVKVVFQRGTDGVVSLVDVTIGSQQMRGAKRR